MATDAVETKHAVLSEVTESKGPERRRQGKFQPFRRLFGKKTKKKERRAQGLFDGAELKAGVSTGEVCNGLLSEDEEYDPNLRESNPIGARALSHDSIFIPEEPVTVPGQGHSMSQENVSDKVRNLQRQIAQGIKFGQRPPSLRRSEGDEGSSDEEEVPRSPLKVLAQVEAEPPQTEAKVQAAPTLGTPAKSPRSKRVLSPTGTIESVNLDAVPQSAPRLDNAAAKHKLSIKPKNQRVSRKHRRFTQDFQDFQEVSVPGVVQEDLEAAGVSGEDRRRASVDESLESFKKQSVHDEERQEARRKREMEEQRLRQEEDERRSKAEEMRLRHLEEENERSRLQQQQQEEEQRRVCEEAERKSREQQQQEEEERRIREEEERRRREEEERMRRDEEERRMREEEERRQREEEEEERRRLEEQRRKEEEERRRQEEREEAESKRRLKEEEERKREEEAEKLRLQEMEEKKEKKADERRRRKEEEQRRLLEEADGSSDPQEKRRKAEELRWREMEERQRPFSFKVSSGEKQILFQKVNLTPVTPASGLQSAAAAEHEAPPSEGPDSPNLPASPYVPHTAILVTGAQLCGTAVNLDHIRDTACKSLLGLGEDRRAQGTPPAKSKTSPDRKSGKTKSLNESALSADQSGADILAEWASIRSKIFKGVEDGKYEDHQDASKNPPPPGGEEQHGFPHSNLRKTMSASAKFSITPAKKKFGDSSRNSEVFAAADKEAGEEAPPTDAPTSPAPTGKPQNRTSKSGRIAERGSEECVFAKDLPSFLVPSPGAKSEGKEPAQGEATGSDGGEGAGGQGPDGEEQPSPFGIKLRRTNFSLRFHGEQSTEKRKKRYSAGDSFDGVPSPLTPIELDSDASSVFSDKSSPASPQREGAACKYLHACASPAGPRAKPGKSPSPTPQGEGEKVLSKPPMYRRSTASPKQTVTALTPPPSPLPQAAHVPPREAALHRTGCVGPSGQEQRRRSEEHQGPIHGEEEPKEKRSFFPSINIPWREKVDRKTELMRREKPSLQSRHSLDSARVQDKEAGPLWITLALQKQKGFREQQQNRDERRSLREVKLTENKSRDSVTLLSPTESKGSGCRSPSKPRTPDGPRRPDSLLGRLERKDQLKKANTLPSSVTVEIADSTPSPPAVKDVSKRFPSSDSPQVSTEPAWLALAKRKAKAWSDCPQIIK